MESELAKPGAPGPERSERGPEAQQRASDAALKQNAETYLQTLLKVTELSDSSKEDKDRWRQTIQGVRLDASSSKGEEGRSFLDEIESQRHEAERNVANMNPHNSGSENRRMGRQELNVLTDLHEMLANPDELEKRMAALQDQLASPQFQDGQRRADEERALRIENARRRITDIAGSASLANPENPDEEA